ncbi:hypothetical protein RvY_09449 [Ramazzottius varieornatus]|uniref:RNA-binding S4 domain-containing protein n=1 Tax=Ramazzottius varieornatus TaxID=947166 RepID=A0A1D1VHA8_RAMVA|nr:hypothetical protein RvY_09449 [Ramazzottius varieornatus]
MAANRMRYFVLSMGSSVRQRGNLPAAALRCARYMESCSTPRSNLLLSTHTAASSPYPYIRAAAPRNDGPLCDCAFSRGYLTTSTESALLHPSIQTTTQRRFKKKSARPMEAQENLDEDEETSVVEEDSSSEPKEWKDMKIYVISPRLDSLIKAGLNASRTKAEEMFYEGRLRLNGEKVTKKSAEAAVGDELDVVIGYNENNPEFLDVQRIVVDEIGNAIAKGKITVTVRVWKTLVVENYPGPNKFSLTGNKS